MTNKPINRLKVVLVEQDKTGVWLSEQLGKHPSTVSLWCSNKIQPSLEMLDTIADSLGVDRVDLINNSK
ncbi:MAG: helix-turn-helix transcriptional regulator [Rikenellaceae bacterium]